MTCPEILEGHREVREIREDEVRENLRQSVSRRGEVGSRSKAGEKEKKIQNYDLEADGKIQIGKFRTLQELQTRPGAHRNTPIVEAKKERNPIYGDTLVTVTFQRLPMYSNVETKPLTKHKTTRKGEIWRRFKRVKTVMSVG